MDLEVISRSPKHPVNPVPLVFVHGAFAAAWIWDENFLPFFADQGYHVHALSLRGHGESDGAEKLLFSSLTDYVEDVRRIVQPLEQPPIVIGHSMGGMVAQRYARDYAVRGLVLMASAPPHGLLPSSLTMATRHPLLMQQLTIMQTLGPSMVNFRILRRALFSDSLPDDRVARYFMQFDGESLWIPWELMSIGLGAWKKGDRVPVLVQGAENDAFVPASEVKATGRAYGVEAKIFPGMAHAMMLDTDWRKTAEHLLGWLETQFAATPETV